MYNYQFVWKQKHNHAKHYIETHSLYNENMAMHAPSQGTMGNRPTNIHTQGSNLYVKNMCSLAGAG